MQGESDWEQALREALAEGCRALRLPPLTPTATAQLVRYAALMVQYNREVNLTRITEPRDIAVKHFVDSLSVLRVSTLSQGASVVDVGTGAGLPGLPLKLVRPDLHMVLVDSLAKRTAFLETVVSDLGLSGVEVIHARAEDVGRDKRFRERFDWAVARAVARLNILAEYLLPLARVGGHALALKGPDVAAELSEAAVALRTLGGGLPSTFSVSLPEGAGDRILVVIEKNRPTPHTYPRKAGLVSRRPLGQTTSASTPSR